MPSSEVNEEAEKDGECVESRLHSYLRLPKAD
jgi:hypothetical protein